MVPTKTENPKSRDSNLTFWLILIIGSIGILSYHLFYGKLKNMNPLLNEENKRKKNSESKVDSEVDIYNDEIVPEEFIVDDPEDEH